MTGDSQVCGCHGCDMSRVMVKMAWLEEVLALYSKDEMHVRLAASHRHMVSLDPWGVDSSSTARA